MTPPLDYPALLAELDAWQAAASLRLPGVIPCRAGCSACCLGPFDISAADSLVVRNGVRGLPEPLRRAIGVRALDQLERMRAVDRRLEAPWEIGGLGDDGFDALLEPFEDDPCPALDEHGRCQIYESRPMVCRVMGLGMRLGSGDLIENACPIQGEFSEYAALPPEPFALEEWEAREEGAKRRAAIELFGDPARAGFETTVAGAILLAFE
ncbi:MAG: YkgJ family cysteine cluster protein [Gemmatimonadales bacterium]|nr:YkgJ family cysteine cluster protein [Gemmatimonadales bacterium]